MEKIFLEFTDDEIEIIKRIDAYQYTGGAYKRASFIDKVCRNKKDKIILNDLCKKGFAEIGLGGTVAGDTYRGCWLTEKGKALLEEIKKNK